MTDEDQSGPGPAIDWRDGAVIGIRDFRYAPYCVADAEIRELKTE